eukprot:TRINITY_DN4937_c0_g2_i1.p1 TRINITY_DN4937_c0_g2~~TRINITY_DN4937_c0_g2_i1.p1  ORF type:complete len:123 (+),score=26.84 TRINITY_DN4937_c0_g2_i1:530-898(+)
MWFLVSVLCTLLSVVLSDGPCVSSGRKYNTTVADAFTMKTITQNLTFDCDPYNDKDCLPLKFPSKGDFLVEAVVSTQSTGEGDFKEKDRFRCGFWFLFCVLFCPSFFLMAPVSLQEGSTIRL